MQLDYMRLRTHIEPLLWMNQTIWFNIILYNVYENENSVTPKLLPNKSDN
jgi:hypothetical protein